MIESLGIIAIVALFVWCAPEQPHRAARTRDRRAAQLRAGKPPAAGRPEQPSEALAATLETPAAAESGPWAVASAPAVEPTPHAVPPYSPLDSDQPETAPAASTLREAAPVIPKQADIETALGTRWAVWVGGLALALGGLFLIRYSIEAGIFGPGTRLAMAGMLGLVLVGGGEFIRRTGFKVPVEGAAGAYVPGILTAAGAFTLFGTIYAAHGVYGFIGPGPAFFLLGVIGVATIAAALVHGQALAGVGLLGAMLVPLLVSSQSPNVWALFGYLAIVLVANTIVARMRDWKLAGRRRLRGHRPVDARLSRRRADRGLHRRDVHQHHHARHAGAGLAVPRRR